MRREHEEEEVDEEKVHEEGRGKHEEEEIDWLRGIDESMMISFGG